MSNGVLIGGPERKSHLAIAIARALIRDSRRGYFDGTTTALLDPRTHTTKAA
ncbi:hypothetical protein [Mesorhizobium sp. 131-3-5]|uniref:hypothetical protein n=1 Tax=Mesorhizobium sp. 131-3-5 TaxID=2744520 RepID=UPI0018EB3EE9|nr:hypothetical protein [Mesorhizobium sp. 131-3-5]